jgi:hypothetical protein
MPADFIPDQLVENIGSTNVVPSVALTNANEIPPAFTVGQSIVPS